MMKAMELLNEKNSYLEQFLGLNTEWLKRLNQNDFSNIEKYREDRESILNIVKHIDERVEEETVGMVLEDIDEKAKDTINKVLSRKDALVKAILAQDLEIMEIIEAAKGEIIKELTKVRRNRRTISSYRSYRRKDNLDEEI